jgi:hypothetical protein
MFVSPTLARRKLDAVVNYFKSVVYCQMFFTLHCFAELFILRRLRSMNVIDIGFRLKELGDSMNVTMELCREKIRSKL